jgi:hypothetical protein
MKSVATSQSADQRRLVWCTLFASLFKFETRCDADRARMAATAAFERHGAREPFAAVASVIRGELSWPADPDAH